MDTMDTRHLVGYVFLGLSIAVFVLTLREIYIAIRLKKYGKKAFGKIIGVKRLPGRDKYGQYSNALIIEIDSENEKFTYDCLNSHMKNFPYGKVPILYLKNNHGKRICNIDSWYILLTNAIFYFAISLALTIPYFIVNFTSVKN
jgi:hypothetical protein